MIEAGVLVHYIDADGITHSKMSPSPMLVTTMQAAMLSGASNIAAQAIETYQAQVSPGALGSSARHAQRRGVPMLSRLTSKIRSVHLL